jgi:uncharacterized protein (DUF302 family)
VQAFETTLPGTIDDVEGSVRKALQEQGFGVLTEIDVAATLKAKLGVERAPLKILGACNPTFANRALDIDPAVSLLLPCNVVIEATDGGTHVAIVDPRELMSGASFAALADEAAEKLETVITTLNGSVASRPTKEPGS